MAGAAVIVAVTNALARSRLSLRVRRRRRELRGAGREAGAAARQALAETATWVREDLDLTLRIGMVPVARHSRAGPRRPRRALCAVGEHLDRDVLGGGMAWADAAMKRGEIAFAAAPPGAHPDLSGLSCRYEEIPASRGVVLSLVVAPGPNGRHEAFRAAIEEIARIVEKTPDASRPVPGQRLRFTWPPAGASSSRRAPRAARTSRSALRQIKVLVRTFFAFRGDALRHHGRRRSSRRNTPAS